MKHHVKKMIKEGISGAGEVNQGYPKLTVDDVVPRGEVYTLNPNRNSRPRATATHRALPYLRQHAVSQAVIRMKNSCIFPVAIKNIKWSNFAQFLYTFHVHYCDLEGIPITQDLARHVLLYLFYGTYMDKLKSAL